jgi:putative membrane protein
VIAHAEPPEWTPVVALVTGAALVSWLHLRGALRARRRWPRPRVGPRVAAFESGMALLLIAVASPLDALADRSFACHMAQHVLLMMLAPPLLWLGSPWPTLWLGLPGSLRRRLAPLLRVRGLHALARQVTRPAVCWLAFVLTTWLWHLPSAYEWALHDELVHDAEHLSFLGTGLLFWWPVIHPGPTGRPATAWWILPYLSLAMLENTAFSALFTFSDRVFYPSYATAAPPEGIDPLTDQALGGAIMWLAGSLAMLVPGVLAVVRLLGPEPAAATGRTPASAARGRPGAASGRSRSSHPSSSRITVR